MRYQFLRFPGSKPKVVTFSYDDGCPYDMRLADTLSSYGLKCTFNITGDGSRKERGLTKEDVKEHILGKGHEIAVHGDYHRAEGTLREIEGIREVLDCRLELENKYGMIIRGMAYPDTGITRFTNSASYEKVRKYLTELDIVYARTLGKDNNEFELPEDWLCWMPTAHHNNPKIFEYADEFLVLDFSEKSYIAATRPRLFYIWGHSFEFENNGNWSLLDEICEKLSGKDDIWYATNIEIYDYVKAYNSLIYSADGTKIYNPTLHTVWMEIDRKNYSVNPGETLKLN